MAEVTFSARPWVWFEIRGEVRGPGFVRDDDGLTQRMMNWMMDQKIDWRAQRTGGGAWVGRIPLDDAAKVSAWLKKHGATETYET